MSTGPGGTGGSGGAARATLWNETADFTRSFWGELAALVVLGGGSAGDTSDHYAVDVSENGMLVRDPAFRSRRSRSDTRFLSWVDIVGIRPHRPGTGRFVTVLLADGTQVELGERHATSATRQARLDALDRWYQTHRSPIAD